MVYFFFHPPLISETLVISPPPAGCFRTFFSSLPVDSGLLFPRLPPLVVVVSRHSQQAARAKWRALMPAHECEGSAALEVFNVQDQGISDGSMTLQPRPPSQNVHKFSSSSVASGLRAQPASLTFNSHPH